jgi:heptosyltransferase-2
MKKFLVIQTSFIGDVILATALLESLHKKFPDAKISFMLRKGNEMLLENHPFLENLYVWDKKIKYKSLFKLLKKVRAEKFDVVLNLQRFATTGFFTALSGAKETRGFAKNPVSFLFDKKFPHEYKNDWHEINRNFSLAEDLCENNFEKPRLYPQKIDFEVIAQYQTEKYICLAPSSVWFTKQFPVEKWLEMLHYLNFKGKIFLLGAKSDVNLCEKISRQFPEAEILAGKLTLLQSAALMQNAEMNFANDSSPLHLAASVNAKITAVFCSTVPEFGFFPLSDLSFLIQQNENLPCRPCNLHGKKECPLGHFLCAEGINKEQFEPVKTFLNR